MGRRSIGSVDEGDVDVDDDGTDGYNNDDEDGEEDGAELGEAESDVCLHAANSRLGLRQRASAAS